MATKSEQKIYIAAGVLAVLGVGLFVQQKSNSSEAMAHSQAGGPAALPEIKVPADDIDKITSFSIKNGTKGEVTLEKQGDKWQVTNLVGRKGEYYLFYLGREAPREWAVELPRAGQDAPLSLRAEIIDTWNMTITPVDGTFLVKPSGRYTLTPDDRPKIKLSGKPYLAIRLRKAT